MSKILMRLHLPEPKVRKATAKAEQKHKDKSKYSRKVKHKGSGDHPHGAFIFGVVSACVYIVLTRPILKSILSPRRNSHDRHRIHKSAHFQ